MASDGDVGAPVAKKMKTSDSEIENGDASKQILRDFSVFTILREDVRAKMIVVHGKFEGREEDAVLLLEKLPFDSKTVGDVLKKSSLHETLKNDIYSTHESIAPAHYPGYKTTMIYPATERHIAKYSDEDEHVVDETTELYEKVTRPCLDKSTFSLQWVYNILEKKTESDRIVFEDPDPDTGFLLLPDMKWDRKDTKSLYLVAIVHRRDIESLRSLRKEHLPLLKNILQAGTKAISAQFDIPKSKLRIYVHYQPSYYHFHVHFTHVKFDAPGSDVFRAHLLSSVIENIERDESYYQNKTLSFVVRESNVLYGAYKNHGYFNN